MKKKPMPRRRTRHQASLQMPIDLRQKIKAIAAKERRSFSAQSVIFLESAVLKTNTDKETSP